MLTINNFPLYDYPIMLTKEDIENYTGIKDIGQQVINLAHEIIYDFLIYPTYNEDIKNRIITRYLDEVEKPLRKALLAQVSYIYDNGGDIGSWNGLMRNNAGETTVEQQEILTKIICPKAINILKGATIDLLYCGG